MAEEDAKHWRELHEALFLSVTTVAPCSTLLCATQTFDSAEQQASGSPVDLEVVPPALWATLSPACPGRSTHASACGLPSPR